MSAPDRRPVFLEAGTLPPADGVAASAASEGERWRQRAVEAVTEAQRAYFEEAEPAQAARMLGAVLADIGDSLAAASALHELAQLHYWHGVTLAKTGQTALAEQAFARAASLGAASPEPGRFPPEVENAAVAGYGAAAAAPAARLTVSSTPPGARLSIDGRRLASVTPATMTASVGEHFVAIDSFGYQTAVRKVAVPLAGARIDVTLSAAPPPILSRQIREALAGQRLDLESEHVLATLARCYGAQQILRVLRHAKTGPKTGPKQTTPAVSLLLHASDGRLLRRAELAHPSPAAARLAELPTRRDLLWPPPPKPVWKKWWFWTALGVAVGAATAATVVGIQSTTTQTMTFRVPK